ncbi:MAG TPA: M1 family aminopeptidase [Bryobacteraceae bacterium]|nr:M1 family aminopeptidase [Bryobacteraceae bacterium]
MRWMSILLWSGLVLADQYPRQPGVDVRHYTFRVTLNDDNDEIAGETTVALLFVKDGVAEFALDLASAAEGKGMTVSEVTSDKGAVRYAHQAGRLAITPDSAPKAGEVRRFTVRYHGIPAGGLRILKNKYGDRCFFSANWPDLAHQWLPTIDHPYDKATSEFIVTAPARYQVVANGLLQEEIDLADGRRVTHWKQSVPIATWLNTIGVARFASRHFGTAAGVPLQTWVYPQDRDAGIATFEVPSRQAIEFYADHIGPYPYEKLADVQSAGNGGGMEHASAIFFGERSVTGQPAFGLVAHETAHQWFGDSVTEKDWDDVWLSEGFATYFTLLTTEYYQGRDAFVAGLKRSRTNIFTTEKRLPGVAVVQDKPWKGIPNGIVYQKGGWTLHLLRGQIGTEKFWAGIREYYKRYRDSNASTEDFRKVMEQVSGADLGWFFRQWLYRAGSPVVEGGWRYSAASKKIEIELAQTQPGDPYRLPLEVGIAVAGLPGARIEKIVMTAKQQRFEVAADREPASVELDPNTWMLMDAKFAKR